MNTQSLNHLQISVSNLERSVAFYTGLLGMRELFRDGTDLIFLQSTQGDDVFALSRTDGPVDIEAGGMQHFGFLVKREEHRAAVEEARSFGVEVLNEGQHGDGSLYAYIRDPDGYLIEIGG